MDVRHRHIVVSWLRFTTVLTAVRSQLLAGCSHRVTMTVSSPARVGDSLKMLVRRQDMNSVVATIVGGVALGFFGAGSAQAVVTLHNGETLNLGSLLAPGSDRMFIVEDKLFTFESFTSSSFNPQNFSIIGFVSAGVNQYGLHNVGFDLTGPFGDGSPGDLIVHEMNLQYNVAVLPQFYAAGIRLSDARLTFNGSSTGDGSFSRVDESIFDLDQNQFLGQLSVFDVAGPPRSTQLTDGADYSQIFNSPGYRAFEVNKDIKMFAAHINDTATASFIRQEFSQIPAPGAAIALCGAGLFAARRRRS